MAVTAIKRTLPATRWTDVQFEAERLGGSAHHHTFDAGEAITVWLPAKGERMFAAHWGETPTAAEQAVHYLTEVPA